MGIPLRKAFGLSHFSQVSKVAIAYTRYLTVLRNVSKEALKSRGSKPKNKPKWDPFSAFGQAGSPVLKKKSIFFFFGGGGVMMMTKQEQVADDDDDFETWNF